ncbi:hypothetical protein [Amycolatopsis sp. cmx-4-61]|uniref:hypothetical protein n=1 Tax=Amycolatopsis sp. cmx-4-61 TaxID=2790937 RepID=UPI00397BB1F0
MDANDLVAQLQDAMEDRSELRVLAERENLPYFLNLIGYHGATYSLMNGGRFPDIREISESLSKSLVNTPLFKNLDADALKNWLDGLNGTQWLVEVIGETTRDYRQRAEAERASANAQAVQTATWDELIADLRSLTQGRSNDYTWNGQPSTWSTFLANYGSQRTQFAALLDALDKHSFEKRVEFFRANSLLAEQPTDRVADDVTPESFTLDDFPALKENLPALNKIGLLFDDETRDLLEEVALILAPYH